METNYLIELGDIILNDDLVVLKKAYDMLRNLYKQNPSDKIYGEIEAIIDSVPVIYQEMIENYFVDTSERSRKPFTNVIKNCFVKLVMKNHGKERAKNLADKMRG